MFASSLKDREPATELIALTHKIQKLSLAEPRIRQIVTGSEKVKEEEEKDEKVW